MSGLLSARALLDPSTRCGKEIGKIIELLYLTYVFIKTWWGTSLSSAVAEPDLVLG